jgi:hypothetical protein
MPDTFGGFNLGTAGYDRTIQTQIERNVIATLRAGLAYTPAGSIVKAGLKPGGNGTVRFTLWSDVDPDLTELAETTPPGPTFLAGDDQEFESKLLGQFVPITYLASLKAGESLAARAVEKVSRMAAEAYNQTAKNAYDALTTFNTGTAPDTLDADALIDIAAELRVRDVEPLADGKYNLIGHPKAFVPFLKDLASGAGAGMAAAFGTIGDLKAGVSGSALGFNFVSTGSDDLAGVSSSHKVVAVGKGSLAMSEVAGNFGVIVKHSGTEDPLDQVPMTVGWRAFVGAEVVALKNRSDGDGNLGSAIERAVVFDASES